MKVMSDLKHWETKDRRLLIDRPPWMRLYEDDVTLPDGSTVQGYLRLETPGYVMVVPVNDVGEIGLVRSYKRGVDAIDLQPPAGVIDPGEDPLASAERELLEELGCRSEHLHPLGSFVLSGNYYGGRAHFYLGTGCQVVDEPDSGDLEEQQVVWLPHEKVQQRWVGGQFQQMSAVAALGLALSHLETIIADGSLKFGV
jgi:8-oxo-dGTP pyrophosphatase MutT (NUDIX family)